MLRLAMAGASAPPPVVLDPYWDNVVAMLHFDGANNSTTFTDVCEHSFSAFGNAKLTTTGPKYGTASGLFDGSGDYLTSPTSADWEFGSGNFTVEGFVNIAAYPSGDVMDILTRWNTYGIGLVLQSGGNWRAYWQNSSGTVNLLASVPPPLNTWSHIAFVRDGSTNRLYMDGVQIASGAVSGSMNTITQALYVASESAAIRYLNGKLDELRITKGVCRYPGGTTFTPPTAAFPHGWKTVSTFTPSTNQAGWSGYTIRHRQDKSRLRTGTKVRLTIVTDQVTNIGAMYIGNEATGGGYDFDGTPVQVTFGGSPTIAAPSGGTFVSDEITLSVSAAKNLILSTYFNSTTTLKRSAAGAPALTGENYDNVLGNSAALVDWVVTSVSASVYGILVTKIEVLQ